jgi:GTPase Era involved in 16S rRNA processing
MHPGWADTPGVETALPRFHALMRPLLRTPAQGADTIVWLASAPEALESNGAFWLDRRRRMTTPLPWTRTRPDDANRLAACNAPGLAFHNGSPGP